MSTKWFDRKSIYHSHLRALEDGGLPCQIVSDLKKSKNGTGQIVRIKPYDDEDEYWLACENEDVAKVIGSLPKNTWLTLYAHGERGSASIEAFDTEGNPFDIPDPAPGFPPGGFPKPSGPYAPTPPPFPPSGGPAPATNKAPAMPSLPDAQTRAAQLQDRLAQDDADMLGSLLRARAIAGQFQEVTEIELSTEDIRTMAISLFIENKRRS